MSKSKFAKSLKTLKCYVCNEPVKNVAVEAVAVKCWKCISIELGCKLYDEKDSTISRG